ncbi:hypothetical protein D6T63_17130 [Arthrobacter cheniae]|uniref:Abasic site processing protein n=1 Tax=Arthrobacter cheniae TaxID=1258888 RepID=A0A3A5M6Y3_9MICC|nr:hypothetical protein D6T63_17130 [Arthrobacter cheniae]
MTEKPSFRTAAAKRRALVPANGYYEWQKNEDGTKTPHSAHEALGHIHDRTPVITPGELQDQWLDPTMMKRDQVQHFIDTIPKPNLIPWIVGKEVGSVRNNGPQLVREVA